MVSQLGAAGRQYRIMEIVGRGGFGTVYRAEMLGAGGFTKQVAIKVLHKDSDAPAEMLSRLRDEARILGLLRHRAIVGVDSLTLFDQGWAVVMEYVPGVDAASIVHGGPVPPRVALEIVEEVASALHAAYAVAPAGHPEPLGLVHRDIKPSNVRVTAQGEVKVLDFGVARANFTAREAHTSAYLFGSLKYMAIERLEGVETPAADIYSLGLMLAELLIGRDLPEPPRQAERFTAYVEQLLEDVLAAVHADPFQSTQGPTAGLLELLRTMLSDNHECRPTAAKVEHSCRSLRQASEGVWLRDWAAVEVPRLAAELTIVERASDSGSVLVERSSPLAGSDQDGSIVTVDEPGPSALLPRMLLFGMLAGILFGMVGIGLIAVWKWALPGLETIPDPPPADPAFIGTEHGGSNQASTGDAQPRDPTPDTQPDPIEQPVESAQPADPSSPATPPEPTRPDPQASQPQSAPELAPTTAQAGPAAPAAHVTVQGDARSVWLVSDAGRYPAGTVPPGEYRISAWFDSPDPAAAGTVTLHDGERVTLNCIGAFAKCSRSH